MDIADTQELCSALEQAAGALTAPEKTDEARARPVLLNALEWYGQSRYSLGAALAAYKIVFKKERGWLHAARLIAEHMGRSLRTVFRILADYERVSGAPSLVLDTMAREGFDPSAPKNAVLLDKVIEAMPSGATLEQASDVVRRTAGCWKRQYRDLITGEDRAVWVLRMEIRRRLNNMPDDRKQEILVRAISEEAFNIWGIDAPFVLSITPRRGPMTVDGRLLQAEEGAA